MLRVFHLRLLEDQSRQARKLEKEAQTLKKKFNKAFWLDSAQYIALGLDGKNKPLPIISSNAAQCLKSGIVDPDKAALMEKRIMSEEMNSGWGIRTISTESDGFDEMSYHNGSVWPHDTSIVINGLSPENASSITSDIFEAALTFPDKRLPELYAGFQRAGKNDSLQTYPESCSPQAWSAGSLVYALTSCLGIKPDTKTNTLKLVDPVLPRDVKEITINKLIINNKPVALKIQRESDDTLKVRTFNPSNLKELSVKKQGKSFEVSLTQN